jgi:hypothetical protein
MLYLNAGASHVIVTSFVFKDGEVNMHRYMHMYGYVCIYRHKYTYIYIYIDIYL